MGSEDEEEEGDEEDEEEDAAAAASVHGMLGCAAMSCFMIGPQR